MNMSITEPLLPTTTNHCYDSTENEWIDQHQLNNVNTTKIHVQPTITPPSTLGYYIPIFHWLLSYNLHDIWYDILAGISVSCILIPQSLSFSVLANLSPIYGIFTSIYPCIIYCILGTSQYLSTGIEATSSILLGKTIVSLPNIIHIDHNSIEYQYQLIDNAMSLTLLVGIISLCMGCMKLGYLDSILSRVALNGFVNGIAIVICIDQLPKMFGIVIQYNTVSYSTIELLYATLSRIHTQINWMTTFVSLLCLTVLYTTKYIKHQYAGVHPNIQVIPDLFIVCILCIVLSYSFSLKENYSVRTLESIPFTFHYSIPTLSTGGTAQLFSSAITIVVLGLTESMLVSKKYAVLEHKSIDSNREFIAIGTANIIGSLFGAYTAFGSLTRSKLAYTLHARSQLYSVFTALSIVTFVTLAVDCITYLPLSCTSSIVFSIALSLLDYNELLFMYNTECYIDSILCVTMTLITILFGVDVSILFGLIICLFIIVKQSIRSNTTVLHRNHADTQYHALKYNEQASNDIIILYRIDSTLFHANAEKLMDSARLYYTQYSNSIQYNIIDCTLLHTIDSTGLHVIYEIIEFYQSHNISVVLCGCHNTNIIQYMKSANIYELLTQMNIYSTYEQCINELTGTVKQHDVSTHMSNRSIDMLNADEFSHQ